jgi:eukaryotic-like serine/threonine-protein kinase
MAEPPDSVAHALRDRYTLQRELGRGGMAVVYLAHDVRHGRPVALKILHPDVAAALGPDRFLREIQLTASLQHPHILPIHDSGEASGRLWYTMPYFEGESLRERLKREPQLPVEDVLQIARNILAALAQAHRHGILHRDIKPENILLETGEAVLADFGIARAIDAAGAERLTETGLAVGTPVYMSPEQATGSRELDARSDLYAVGCMLYEMLAGHAPFQGTTSQEILRRHVMDPVPPLRSARSDIPESVDRAITKALAKAPADRWSSAQQFAEALRETGPANRPRRARVALGAGAVVAMALAAAFIASRRSEAPASGIPRLAVLPFENLGDSADAYFADGVADAVRGKLTVLPGVEVIARASSMAYRQTSKPPELVARELGVRYLLTGTVRWSKGSGASRVQVSPELVEIREAGAPASRWQQPFDAALTDVFEVQADIAGRVAQALHLALDSGERQQLADRPTASLAAYDAYLKGEAAAQAFAAWDRPTLRRAAGFYEEAVALDSSFGLAWARSAEAYANLYGSGLADPDLAEAARRRLERAERLAPAAPETYQARLDYESLVRQDLPRALAIAEEGLARQPAHSGLMAGAAVVELQLGRLDAATARLRRAEVIDPQSFAVAQYIGFVLYLQRRWAEARRAYERALSLVPTDLGALEFRLSTFLSEGDLEGARRALAETPPAVDRLQQAAIMADHDLFWLLERPMQDRVLALPPAAFDDNRGKWGVVLAECYRLRGDARRAGAYADSARVALEEQLEAVPDDPWLHVTMGHALAILGRKAEAIAEGERANTLLPITRDAMFGAQVQQRLVRIYIIVGEPEKALDKLEPLLEVPYWLSPEWLRLEPTFAPLKGNPRFEKLVAGK